MSSLDCKTTHQIPPHPINKDIKITHWTNYKIKFFLWEGLVFGIQKQLLHQLLGTNG